MPIPTFYLQIFVYLQNHSMHASPLKKLHFFIHPCILSKIRAIHPNLPLQRQIALLTRPRIQHLVRRNLPVLERNLQRHRLDLARVIGSMPLGAEIRRVRSDDQPILASLDVRLGLGGGECDVGESGDECDVSVRC